MVLGAHRVIDVSGADAETFLQGQLCNDVVALAAGDAQLTGYCTPKGRLLAAPILQRTADGFRFFLPEPDVAEAFAKRLGMFVMRSDVKLARRDDVAVLALFGDAPVPFALPDGDPLCWRDDPEHGARRLAVVATDTAAGLPDGEAHWRLADIRAGLASVRTGSVESFVPQMVNFRETDALSFTKGCYPGQEIVARTQYLGKQKRHMQRLVAAGEGLVVPVPGASIGEAGVAEVVDAVATAHGVELLAVVRIGAADEGLPLEQSSSVLALPAELPYEPIRPDAPESAS